MSERALRQLDEAAVWVAQIGGAAPGEVAWAVDADPSGGERGCVIVEAADGERDVIVGRRVAGRGLDRSVEPEHGLSEREDGPPGRTLRGR